jgi:acetylornithine deacetylase
MIERLVAFDTVSSKSNLALIDFVAESLERRGVASRRSFDAEGGKANLFATLGPDIAGGIVLSGHSDVVPVDGQPWDGDPFRVVQREGRLYGRGTADMKSFLAVALALVPEMLAADLRVPIHLAISYDEEVGCIGVRGLIADVTANLPLPRLVIVGEPSDMKIVNAHKGVTVFRTTVTGKEAHSSQPHRAANAIEAAARLVGFLADLAEEKRRQVPADSRFEPPFTSFNVGTIEGGTAQNIVPRHCSFTWEFRELPGDDGAAILERFTRFAEDQVLPGLRATAPEAAIVTEALAAAPALRPEPDSEAEALVRALTGANTSHAVSFAAEAGLFQQAGFSAVICGPGSIDQAHQANEFVELAQVEACEAVLRRLIDWAARDA